MYKYNHDFRKIFITQLNHKVYCNSNIFKTLSEFTLKQVFVTYYSD